jgi:RNA polymerase sigma factor (sigma-70 family)
MNRIRDELRRHDRRGAPEPIDGETEDAGPSPVEHAIGRQALERYERALARLRPGDREAIIARVEMDCSYEQLAEMLGKPTAAARKASQRALIRLAAEMKRVR